MPRITVNDVWSRLERINEATANTYKLVEKQEAHLRELNDSVLHHSEYLAAHKEKIDSTRKHSEDTRTYLLWLVCLTVTSLATSGAAVYCVMERIH